MKKALLVLTGLCMTMITINAQLTSANNPLKGKEQIEKLCGCYEVEFKYVETFSPDPNYKYRERDEINGGIELILPIETSDKKMVLQHLLVISDSMIIKHWREDWTYEEPTIFRYQGNKVWTKHTLQPDEVKGKWTQSVWEVSDAPRYQGSSEWINTDSKTLWQNTSDAPLPRREYTIRSDYNVLKRTNRIVINKDGWVHEQDNQKIIRAKGVDKLLVEEKGINSYKKADDSKCASARKYWEKYKDFWTRVRSAWQDYLSKHTTVELKDLVDGKPLHQQLSDLAKEVNLGKVKGDQVAIKIRTSLEKYIGKDQSVAQSQ